MGIAAGLLQEDDLIDSGVLQGTQVPDHVVRCADAGATRRIARRCRNQFVGAPAPLGQILAPQIRAPRYGVVRDKRVERIAEKLEALLSAPDRLSAVAMQRERRN